MKRPRKRRPSRQAGAADSPPSGVRTVSFRERFEWRWILRRVSQRGVPACDAEDVAQDIVIGMAMAERRMVLREGQSPADARRALLRGIVRLQVANYVRKSARRPLIEPDEAPEAVLDPALNAEERALAGAEAFPLRAALAELREKSPEQHTVLVAYAEDELPMNVVAAVLGIPPNTAWNRLRLARIALRDALHRLAARERFTG